MKLTETQESIVPGQSEIDSWPQLKRNHEQSSTTQEIVFDAEKWIYERKSAYPMVETVPGSTDGDWKNFRYHPACNGIVLHDKDIITLGCNGSYSVKSKDEPTLNNDEAKFYATYLEASRYAP